MEKTTSGAVSKRPSQYDWAWLLWEKIIPLSCNHVRAVSSSEKIKYQKSILQLFSCQLGVAIYPSVTQLVVDWSHWSGACRTSSPLNFLPSTCCFSWFAPLHISRLLLTVSDQQVFFPMCFAQQILVDKPLPLPPQVKLNIFIWSIGDKSTVVSL